MTLVDDDRAGTKYGFVAIGDADAATRMREKMRAVMDVAGEFHIGWNGGLQSLSR